MRAKGACTPKFTHQSFVDFNEILDIFKEQELSGLAIIMLYFAIVLYTC